MKNPAMILPVFYLH